MPEEPESFSGLRRWIQDPFPALSHALGAVLSVLALVFMLSVNQGGALRITALAVYGASLIFLFSASAAAHTVRGRFADRFNRLDYAAIFFLIAGTYTPICLMVLRGAWGWTLLAIVWTMALAGAGVMLLSNASWRRWMPLLYVVMGWLVLAAAGPLLRTMPADALFWLAAGGIVYTLGAVVFITGRPRLWRWFGSHDLWHVMVLIGSGCHLLTVFQTAV